MRSNAWWHANLALLKTIQPGNMQQERASGRTIRGCLSVRGYASAAGVALVRQSFRLCAALFRGGSISRLPPPTETWSGNKATAVVGSNHRDCSSAIIDRSIRNLRH